MGALGTKGIAEELAVNVVGDAGVLPILDGGPFLLAAARWAHLRLRKQWDTF